MGIAFPTQMQCHVDFVYTNGLFCSVHIYTRIGNLLLRPILLNKARAIITINYNITYYLKQERHK